MGIGKGSGEKRAEEAAKSAIHSPLLETSIDGAKGILFSITGGSDLGMNEVSEAAKIITQNADSDAKVIFGTVIDESLKDEIRITVIATGFGNKKALPSKNNNYGLYANSANKRETDINKITGASKINEIEIPTIIRKAEENKIDDEDDDEELEIPAFLRKKM